MASGMESMLKMLGFDAKEITANVMQLAQIAIQVRNELQIVRKQNSAILAALGIADPGTIGANALNGSGKDIQPTDAG